VRPMNRRPLARRRPKRTPKDVTVRIGGSAALPAVLSQLGFDPTQVVAEAGVDPALFDDIDNLISFVARGRLLGHCVARTRCAHFGLLLGQQAQLEHLGLLGRLVQSTPDVGTALRSLVRYSLAHVRGAVITLEVYGASARLGYASVHPEVEATDQISDGSIAFLFKILRTLCGPAWRPTELLFARREPEDLEPFQQYFRAPLRFNAAQFAIVFAAEWLAHRLPTADPASCASLQLQVEALVARHREDFPEHVRCVLRTTSLTGPSRLDDVAAAMSLHARTVGRRLAAAGVTFQALVDEDRFERARQLLENTALEVNDIAAALDYADASGFIRAFRRWTGTTPGDWRAQPAAAR
jgi:AraC-like DNA-binding protein